MNQTVFKRLREQYEKELGRLSRPGYASIFSYLDSHDFFTARCSGHDQFPGGTASHSLWVLKFARETLAARTKSSPVPAVSEDSVILVCLLHDICDCNPGSGHGRRSREILERLLKGFRMEKAELKAIERHMHDSIYGDGGKKSSRNSTDQTEFLHYLLLNSDHRACEYGNGIPFGESPKTNVYHQAVREACPATLLFDEKDHRLWRDEVNLTMGTVLFDESFTAKFREMKHVEAMPRHFFYFSDMPCEPELTIMENDRGKALLTIYSLGYYQGAATLDSSDRRCFGYKELYVYVSKYPGFRPSYIVASDLDGRWGVLSVKVRYGYDNIYPRVATYPCVDFVHPDPDSAIRCMKNGKYQIRIGHTDFFKKFGPY